MTTGVAAFVAGRRLSVLIAVILAASAALAAWVFFDRPVPVAVEWRGPLQSVSFAAFRRGQDPLKQQYPGSQQVESDMRSLIGVAKGLRTYSAGQGMEVVPGLARRLGFEVTYGAWLTNRSTAEGVKQNDSEIASLIDGANRYPDVVPRVIVGNEVLLRGDLTPDQLITYLRQVKAAVHQPVSYADVWVFFLRYPEVARELDFLTVHILPFWEDEPMAVGDVDRHITEVIERLQAAFPGKPILIGETGWPSIGRDRGPAVVNTVNQARYVRDVATLAARQHYAYNIVEAFDQPWKSALENTVGAAWGVLDVDARPKFPMTGPVVEVQDWPLRAALALTLGALGGWIAGCRLTSGPTRLCVALIAQILAWAFVTSAFHIGAVTFRDWQYAWAPLRIGLAGLMALAVGRAACRDLRGDQPYRGVAAALPVLLPLYGVYAVLWSALLLLDGRYRDIPDLDFLVPVVGVALLTAIDAWLRSTSERPLPALWRTAGRGLAIALPLAALASLASEAWALWQGVDFQAAHRGFAAQLPLLLRSLIDNREMDLWAFMQLVLALPFARDRRPDTDAMGTP